MTPEEIKALIRKKAIDAGIDPTQALTMASIETGGTFDPKAGAGKRYQGLYQFGPNEWKTYGGGGDILDPNAQIDAYTRYMPVIQNTMKMALGRDPTPQELYLGWQQGAGGASSLLKGADKPVGQLTTIGNVTANGGTPNMTGGQFAALWHNKYNTHQRAVLGQQGQWGGEGDTQESPWINPPPNVAESQPAVAAAPTQDDWRDMVGYGGSPKRLLAENTDADAKRVAGASSKLTGMGLGLLSAGEGSAPQQPAWIQQAMAGGGAGVHRPQMQGGLLTDIFKDPEEEKRRRMYAGLLGE